MKGEAQTVPWRVWNKYNIPRHSFIAWLLAHDRLRTRDRLIKAGVDVCGDCLLCGIDMENANRVFFQCQYSNMCKQ